MFQTCRRAFVPPMSPTTTVDDAVVSASARRDRRERGADADARFDETPRSLFTRNAPPAAATPATRRVFEVVLRRRRASAGRRRGETETEIAVGCRGDRDRRGGDRAAGGVAGGTNDARERPRAHLASDDTCAPIAGAADIIGAERARCELPRASGARSIGAHSCQNDRWRSRNEWRRIHRAREAASRAMGREESKEQAKEAAREKELAAAAKKQAQKDKVWEQGAKDTSESEEELARDAAAKARRAEAEKQAAAEGGKPLPMMKKCKECGTKYNPKKPCPGCIEAMFGPAKGKK